MGEWDTSIGSLFDLFNLRFAPAQQGKPGQPSKEDAALYGGITEMAALQKEFQIFRVGRPFAESARVLGLGGLDNNLVKNRWMTLLADLASYDSDKADENGDQRIVNALIANLAQEVPHPCFLRSHSSNGELGRRVVVTGDDRPLHYMDQAYLTISIPMLPRTAPRPRPAAPRRPKKA